MRPGLTSCFLSNTVDRLIHYYWHNERSFCSEIHRMEGMEPASSSLEPPPFWLLQCCQSSWQVFGNKWIRLIPTLQTLPTIDPVTLGPFSSNTRRLKCLDCCWLRHKKKSPGTPASPPGFPQGWWGSFWRYSYWLKSGVQCSSQFLGMEPLKQNNPKPLFPRPVNRIPLQAWECGVLGLLSNTPRSSWGWGSRGSLHRRRRWSRPRPGRSPSWTRGRFSGWWSRWTWWGRALSCRPGGQLGGGRHTVSTARVLFCRGSHYQGMGAQKAEQWNWERISKGIISGFSWNTCN